VVIVVPSLEHSFDYDSSGAALFAFGYG